MKTTNPNSYHAKTTNPQQTTSNQTGTPQKGFVSIISGGVRTTNQICLPLYNGGKYNFTAYWGDGGISKVTSYTNRCHTYPSSGNYTIRIQGQIEGFSFYSQVRNTYDSAKLINITKWGPLKLGNLGYYFYRAHNLVSIGTPNLTGTTNLRYMFYNAGKFNQNLSGWNTCKVIDAHSFDVGATSWNESNKPKFLPMRKQPNPQQTTSNQTGTPQKYIVYRIGVIIIGSGDGLIIAQTTDAYTSLSTAEAGTTSQYTGETEASAK